MFLFNQKSINKINRVVLYFLVFLFPVFFTLKTTEYFEFNKFFLLYFLVIAMIIFYVWQRLGENKNLNVKKAPLDLAIGTFLLVYFVASLFSQDKYSSFFGYKNIYSCFLVIFLLAALFFLINNSQLLKNYFNLIRVFLYSASISVIIFLLSFFGFFNSVFPYFSTFFKDAINTAGGSYENFSIFVVIAIILDFGLIYYLNEGGKIKLLNIEILYFKFCLILFFLSLLILSYQISFILLIVGAIIYLAIEFGLRTSCSFFHSEKIFVLFILILLPIIVCIFLNLKPNTKGYLDEPKLDFKNSYLITFSSLKNNFIFGIGPGTFIYNYSLYRDKSINQATDWQYRFYNPHSYLLNILGASGVAGILSYLLILTLIIDLAILYFAKHFSWQNYESIIPLLVPTILLIGAHFVIDFSLLLIFTFWLVLSLFILKLKEAELPGYASKTIAFKNKNVSIFVKFILVVIIFGLVILFYLGTRYWRADFYFHQEDEGNMQKAVELNSGRLNYKTDLAKYYLNKLKVELMKPKSLRSDDIIQSSLDSSLKYANLAVLDQPRSVVAQETAAMVYRDINQLSREKTFEAIKYFETASQLEPTNPVFYTELGKEYLSAGLTNEAEASFYKALELKNDYQEAEFGLAKVLEKQGKTNEALKIFDKLLEIYNDPQIYYEKGRLYFNQGETDKAVENFREAVSLNPSDYNYLYSLSIALDSQDEKVEAQIYLRKALEINPDLEMK